MMSSCKCPHWRLNYLTLANAFFLKVFVMSFWKRGKTVKWVKFLLQTWKKNMMQFVVGNEGAYLYTYSSGSWHIFQVIFNI